jgi:hypothetical protein
MAFSPGDRHNASAAGTKLKYAFVCEEMINEQLATFLDLDLTELATTPLWSTVQMLVQMNHEMHVVLMGNSKERVRVGADAMAMNNDRIHVISKPFNVLEFKVQGDHRAR